MCDIFDYPDSMQYPKRQENQPRDKKVSEIVKELENGAVEIWFVYQDKITNEFYRVLMITKLPK